MTQSERKHKIIAGFTTVIVNALLLLIMFFAGGWGFSGEGLGQGQNYGIEVNLGYDDEGTGTIEPSVPVGTPAATDDEELPPDPAVETVQPSESVLASEPETKISESATFTDPNSDVEINEEKKEIKPSEDQTGEKPADKIDEPVKEKPVETKPVEKPKAVYQGKGNSSPSDANGEGKQGIAGNEGDDVGREGNKGVEGGIKDAAIYKGQPGGGGNGGFGLQMTGWRWAEAPEKPVLQESNIRGRIVFEIVVNDNGEIVAIKTLENQLSPSAERICRQEVEKLTFVKTSSGQTPERTVGRIVFNLELR